MAISYNTGATGSANTASSVAVTIPAGVLAGDVMILALTVFCETGTAPSIGFSGGGGTWTLIPGTSPGTNPEVAANSPIWSYGYAYYRVATAGDPGATLTVTETGSGSGTTWLAAALASYTGANTSTPADVIGGSQAFNSAGPGTITTPSKTTVTANDWAVYLVGGGLTAGSNVVGPAGTAKRQGVFSSASIEAGIWDNGTPLAAGSSIGGGTFSETGGNSGSGWWTSFTIGLAPASAASPNGTAQPRAALPAPRRTAARAAWRVLAGLANAHGPSGNVQPRAAVPVPRRAAARALWRGTVSSTVNAAVSGPGGTVQPRATVPAPRRYPARAAWRGPAAVATVNFQPPAGQQPHGFTSSRRPVGGLWGGAYTPQANASGPSGTVQPRATVPVPRRYPSRVAWRGGTSAAFPAGRVQPRATIAVPRRAAARGAWRAVLGALNARGPAGSVQPRASVAIPRRAASRALWHALAGPGNAHGPSGAAPGGMIARRAHPRAVWRGTVVSTVNNTLIPSGTVPPHPVVARRFPARGQWHGTVVSTVNGAVSAAPAPGQHPAIPRRAAARAVVRGGLAPFPPPAGSVQPEATVPARRHPQQRVIWRGSAVPGQQPEPAAGGLVRRRSTARGQWHGNAGSAPPAAPAGTAATGGKVVTRRPPNRGQWHGNPGPGNAHGPAVPAPKMRPHVASRAAARAVWRGTLVPGSNSRRITLWTVTGARQLWSAGTARQLWSAGTARN